MLNTEFSRIDHLIFGAPDLETGTEIIRQKLGISPSGGGQHPDFGTHNALYKIGARTYFEVIAPDPAVAHRQPRLWMGLDHLETPSLIWWAAKANNLETRVKQAKKAGWDPGPAIPGSRKMADGTLLRWQLTDPFCVQEQGVLPFLIDWGNSPHPSTNMPDAACPLIDFQLLHPQAEKIRRYLAAIDIHFPVKEHPEPKIQAGFATEAGNNYL